MTSCNGCGRCCDPVVLPYTQEEAARLMPGRDIEADVRDFVLHDLTPMRRRDGLAMVSDYMKEGAKTTWAPTPWDPPVITVSHFFTCRHYDQATRSCLNFENRPSICRGFPWYGSPPDDFKAIPPECSFNADLGRPVAVTIR